MVDLRSIDQQVAAIVGAGPAGSPGAIRACAEEFRSDARQTEAMVDALAHHHAGLKFEGPAADRLRTDVTNFKREIHDSARRLSEIARTLDLAATRLAHEQTAHRRHAEAVRQDLINEQRRKAG